MILKNPWFMHLKITLTVVILYSSFAVAEKRYCCSKKILIKYRTASTEKRCRCWTSIGESKMLLFDETRRAVLQNSGFAHEMNVFWSFVHCSDVNLFFLGTVSRDFWERFKGIEQKVRVLFAEYYLDHVNILQKLVLFAEQGARANFRANGSKPFCWHSVCCWKLIYFGLLSLGSQKLWRAFVSTILRRAKEGGKSMINK